MFLQRRLLRHSHCFLRVFPRHGVRFSTQPLPSTAPEKPVDSVAQKLPKKKKPSAKTKKSEKPDVAVSEEPVSAPSLSPEQYCYLLAKGLDYSTLWLQFSKKVWAREKSSQPRSNAKYYKDLKDIISKSKDEFLLTHLKSVYLDLKLETIESSWAKSISPETYRGVVRTGSGSTGLEAVQSPRSLYGWTDEIYGGNICVEEEQGLGKCLYKVGIGNLPFDIQAYELISHFAHIGEVACAEVYRERLVDKQYVSAMMTKLRTDLKVMKQREEKRLESIKLKKEAAEKGVPSEGEEPVGSKRANEKSIRSCKSDLQKYTLRSFSSDISVYGFVYFTEISAFQRAHNTDLRVFGLNIEDKSCWTFTPTNVLYLSNMPFDVHKYNVEDYLSDHIYDLCLELPGFIRFFQTDTLLITNGSVALEFEDHATAFAAAKALFGVEIEGRPVHVGWVDERYLRKHKGKIVSDQGPAVSF